MSHRSTQTAIDDGYRPLLLYPGAEARPLEEWAARTDSALHEGDLQGDLQDDLQGAESQKVLLVLADGTWRQAHHMLRHSPRLVAACQCVSFSGATTSDFDPLRREPSRHCTSTLEACARALRLLEPTDAAAVHMESALRYMVAAQLRHVGPDGGDPRFIDRRQRTANRAQFRPKTQAAR